MGLPRGSSFKLIMTLALGVLALSGTFASQLSGQIGWFIIILFLSWVFLILSIFHGINTSKLIAQFIMNDTTNWWNESIMGARKSWNMFQCGVIFLVVYGSVFAGNNAFSNKDVRAESQKVQLINDNFVILIKDKVHLVAE